MKILINVPKLSLAGGVANFYKSLKPYWNEDILYNTVGKRMAIGGLGLLILPYDILKFCFRLLSFRPNVVMINPSFNQSSMERDMIFLKIAIYFHFPVIVFIRGFCWEYAQNAPWEKIAKVFNKCSMIYVLANVFKQEFIKRGINAPIILTTTKVDDRLTKDFNIDCRQGKCQNILFLSRIERNKGDFIAVDAYRILKGKYPNLTLTIVGDGNDWKNLKNYIESLNDKSIKLTGRLSGRDVAYEYSNADIYLFPTNHGEGMPNSILEAMLFGLPIITRNVGGVVDFFKRGEMGFVTDSLNPQIFADAIETYILNPELTKRTAMYNHQYALENFVSSKVASRLEKEIKQIIKRNNQRP